jgi:uncharacterized protein RhaS with RHS repeats
MRSPVGTMTLVRGSRPTPTSTNNRTAVNRYYDPSSGLFMNVDPLVAETAKPYGYVGDDPLNAADPLGLEQYKKLTTQQVREVMSALGEDV